jgi:hypothetical protein
VAINLNYQYVFEESKDGTHGAVNCYSLRLKI